MEERPLGFLGTRNKGFQGESYFAVPNPPVAAAITYYLKDDFPTLRDKRRTEEQKIQKAEKPVFYPTYEQLTSEQKEESSYLIFTILDEEGQIIQHLRTPAGKGLHRITWDLRYPALTAASPRDANPATSGPSSTFVFPGSYKVKMSLFCRRRDHSIQPVRFPSKSKLRELQRFRPKQGRPCGISKKSAKTRPRGQCRFQRH